MAEEDYYSCSGYEDDECPYDDDDDDEEEEEEEEDNEAAFFQGIDDEEEADIGRWSIASVITAESLLAAQKEDICKIMDLFAIKEQHARTVLIHNRWNIVKVHDILEKKGRDQLCLEAGVPLRDDGSIGLPSSMTVFTCNVCFDDVSTSEATIMDCGHSFCNDCWTQHFIARINCGDSRDIRCMFHKCNAICDETIVRNLVGKEKPEIARRFDRFLLESYIEDNDKVKWCPRVPHCGNAIRVEGETYCEVECTCGLQFCFNCSLEAHSPCPCLLWNMWVKKWNKESKTAKWITNNTKSCPKCHSIVEKDGGCNLVTCRCGQHFCWLCGGATGAAHTYQRIEGHSCNRFTEKDKQKIELAGRKINRYIHYFKRYQAHVDSYKKERKLKQTVEDTIKILEDDSKIISKDFSWALVVLQRLFRSRRALSYTYSFAYYMFGDELVNGKLTNWDKEIKQNLFEDQQQQLEGNVEKLSMLLEKFPQLTYDKIPEMQSAVTNLSRIVDTSCKEIYHCIDEELLPILETTEYIARYNGLVKAMKLSATSRS